MRRRLGKTASGLAGVAGNRMMGGMSEPLATGEGGRAREFTPEEKARAARAQAILYGVMVVLIFAPLVVWWLLKK